jgi:hypothetical protein
MVVKRLFRNSAILLWGAAFHGPHLLNSLRALPRYLVNEYGCGLFEFVKVRE